MTAEPVPSIHQLMGQVLAELPAIGKSDEAPANMGGYRFRGIESITAELKPLLGKVGVFVVPETCERLDSTRTVGSRGATMFVVDVHVRFTFHGPAGDSLTCSTWGQGTDMGDKATQKAYTSAFKSMLAIAFCIADSATDSERHDVPETTELVDPETVQRLRERMNALSSDQRADLRKQWADTEELHAYPARQLDRMPADRLPLIESLVAKFEEAGPKGEGASGTSAVSGDEKEEGRLV